eukprot:gene10985-12220_t
MGDHVKAIPKMLNLSSRKPTTVEAYSRQVASIATNAQSFGPNSYANIVIDTSTPGAFYDPTQTFLEFDIEIQNSNPYIDYMNLGAAGMASFIEEFRIYNQGTPVEEILQYNVVFEHFMKIGGHAQTEFKLFMENSWRAPVPPNDANELNFVKPPMIDRDGVIMYPNNINLLGDRNIFSSHREQGPALLMQPNVVIQNGAGTIQINNQTGGNQNYTVATRAVEGRAPTTANYGYAICALDTFNNHSSAPGCVLTKAFTNRLDNTYVTWPSTLRPEPIILNQVRSQQEENVKNYRLQDYFLYLVNVKNIPIGVAPVKSFIATEAGLVRESGDTGNTPAGFHSTGKAANFNFNTVANINTGLTTGKWKVHVVLPMFSGLLGCWAEKAFPAMLIAPGSFYIQLKWARMAQAAQFTMDPCRRIFGTYRDYVPSCGFPHGYQNEYRGQVYHTPNGLVGPPDATDASDSYFVITAAGATGNDFAPKPFFPYLGGDGHAPNIADANRYTFDAADNNATNNLTVYGEGYGYVTGNPKPQYIPRLYPWATTTFGFEANINTTCPYTTERNICFGTYLPFSTAQVRRITAETNGSIAGDTKIIYAAALETQTTYLITNLQMTTQQIIVPDEVTASIVRQAADSDISLDAQSVHTYRTICANSESQNIILPIKIASANSLYILFLNTLSQESPYYNSLTGICPFTSYQYVPTAQGFFVGSELVPTFNTINTTDSFSVQLKIGNELFPQYPIRTIPGIVKELQRSVHGTSDMNCNLPYTTTASGPRFDDNTKVTLASDGTHYTWIEGKQFTCPFVPIAALDDQTITNNILFNDYYNRGGAASATAPYFYTTVVNSIVGTVPNYNDRGTYMWPGFLPPESSFVLGFDLDTFPGQSDQARSGRYLGNAPLTLAMTGCKGLNNASTKGTSASDPVIALAFVLHDIRFSIMAGGQMLAYY